MRDEYLVQDVQYKNCRDLKTELDIVRSYKQAVAHQNLMSQPIFTVIIEVLESLNEKDYVLR